MFNANAPIKQSKKNLPSVKAAVQSVQAQHHQAVQVMGGVNALAGVILGVISAGMVTAGQAFNAVAKTMPHMLLAMMQMMQSMQNAQQAECKTALQKILKQLT